MARADFKKVSRTRFHGNCYPHGQWEEVVRTKKQANKTFRKMSKVF